MNDNAPFDESTLPEVEDNWESAWIDLGGEG
jgi:hypothetical protein